MLYYFECSKCKRRSDLLQADKPPTERPLCTTEECTKVAPQVVVRQTNVYVHHCWGCGTTSSLNSDVDFAVQRKAPYDCLKCGTNAKVVLLPPNLGDKPESLKKRKTPGVVPPREVVAFDLEGRPVEKLTYEPVSKKRAATDDPRAIVERTGPVFQHEFAPTDEISVLASSEASYKKQRRIQKEFDLAHGALTDAINPLKSSTHTGRVIPYDFYNTHMTERSKPIGGPRGPTYPKSMKSGPTIVNSAKLVSRDATWDYRELGPNSFLRRLSSLLYVHGLGGGDANNPVEVQAMWARGSLFIASNNFTFTEAIYNRVRTDGSLKATIAAMAFPTTTDEMNARGLTTEEKTALSKAEKEDRGIADWHNFAAVHQAKVKNYQADVVADSFPPYFKYKWRYVFDAIRKATRALTVTDTPMPTETLTIKNATGGYTFWTVVEPVESGKVYFVVPHHGDRQGHFKKKDVHAEQLFFPILTQLAAQLSLFEPAFVGGVKTACRTCHEVLTEAKRRLGDKLILPTDAFGHYWPASGTHTPNLTFDPAKQSLVFGNSSDTVGHSYYDTEVPGSPNYDGGEYF